MNKWILAIGVIGVLSLSIFSACQKDTVILEGDINVAFSLDTLRFDTVFTAVGSATKFFKVYNPNDGVVRLSNIRMENGSSSFFRLNVDGIPGNEIENIEILPNDSLYIFSEVTIDPDMDVSASPFIIEEWVLFDVNGNQQKVLLEAWGQNANYLPEIGANGRTSVLSCDLGTLLFDDPKPYVIYGWLLIDSCNVELAPGTQVYIHGGISRPNGAEIREEGLIGILGDGSIQANGTVEEPVTFLTDRLEDEFEAQGGQWSGITITEGSQGNRFINTIVKNATDGIWVQSNASVHIENTIISNTARFGVIGINANIYASNTLVHSNGASSIFLTQGGDYRFEYCTLANIGNESEALAMDNKICQNDDCTEISISPLKARFKNCIIAGDDDDEIAMDDSSQGGGSAFDYFFQNCIIVVDELLSADQFPNFFENCSKCNNVDLMTDTLFLDMDKSMFSLDTMSVAEQAATPINELLFDIEGIMRDASNPDIGCYEFVE